MCTLEFSCIQKADVFETDQLLVDVKVLEEPSGDLQADRLAHQDEHATGEPQIAKDVVGA